jgi:hypothetical protein
MKLTMKNRSTRRKTCPTATLCTKNPTWTDLGSNPGLRAEIHGTAYVAIIFEYKLGG